MAPLDMKPNELEPYWVPFTANRAFKKRPRLFAGAKGMHYFKPDGSKVIDATSGLFCVNAGHCREPIVKAIQEMAARLDYAPAFQYGHPKVFELASRLALLTPGDLDYAFFSNSGSEAVDTALKIALGYHKARGEGARTRFIGRERGYHGIGFGGMNACKDMAQVEGGPGNLGAEGVSIGAGLADAADGAGIETEIAIEENPREKRRGLDANASGGGSEGPFGGANVGAAAQECCGVANGDHGRQVRDRL